MWSDAILSHIITYKLQDMCVKGTASMSRYREQQQLEDDKQHAMASREKGPSVWAAVHETATMHANLFVVVVVIHQLFIVHRNF